MDVTLSSETERVIAEMLRTGRFASATEAVAEAVLRLQTEHAMAELDAAAWTEIRAKVAEGLRAARQGDLLDGDEFFERLARGDTNRTGADRNTA